MSSFVSEKEQHLNCSLCNWKGVKTKLKRHERYHHNGEDFECESCKKIFKNQVQLTLHNNAVHLKMKHLCDMCDYKATNPGSLRTHKRSIHEGIKEICNQCGHRAFDKGSLLKHMKAVHLGLRPYACDKCDYKASNASNLKSHITTNPYRLIPVHCQMMAVEAVKEKFYCFLGIVHPTYYQSRGWGPWLGDDRSSGEDYKLLTEFSLRDS